MQREANPVIGHAILREVVRANLGRAITRAHLRAAQPGALRFLLREALIEQARAVYRDPAFDAAAAAGVLIAGAQAKAAEARELEEVRVAELDLTAREADQQVKRAARGAEREELLAQLEELEAWYRDLVAVAAGAGRAAIHLDKLPALEEDGTRERLVGAERAAEAVRESWRRFEELNLSPQLALEALFVAIERELRL